ncbi:MAG TPA: efflux RND transporter periplasmic adaptor subunit [Wenzhouxiangellaceae bacterium]|nr:efflux RND transporter periplasmic adaptor subunit [Wenzhouxiangellaceae bacterium]
MRRILSILLLLAIAAPVAWFGLHTGDDSPAAPDASRTEAATTITLTEAVADVERTRVEAVGSAEARRSVTLFAPSSGEVVAVRFEAGERVRSGQVLLELDARDERLALELAEANLADAQRAWSRFERAGESAAFTETQRDAARIALEQARIARDRAKVALDDRTLEAPFGGIIGLTEIDPGDRITTATPVATLDDRSTLLVRFEMPEAFLGQVEVGDEIRLSPWNVGTPATTATVADIDSQVDPATRTFTARARIDNSQDRWRPGMGFEVILELTGREFVRVPELALQWGGNGAYVWVIDHDDRARRQPVSLVQRTAGSVLLDGDLAPGDRVVLEGVQKMSEGRPVEVVDPDRVENRDALRAVRDPGS